MKAIIKTTFFLFLIAGLCTSCSKKKDEKPDNATLIVGTWKLNRIENYFQPEGSTQREFVNSNAADLSIELMADGKFVNESAANSMTYQVLGDKLTVKSGSEGTDEYTITKLDKNNLVLEEKYEDEEYNDKTGTIFLVFTFIK